jgi:hypothetical protein
MTARSSPGRRLPRYRRAAVPPQMLLTDRDETVVQLVHELRFATREQVQALAFSPTTTSACKRRLTLLYHNRFLDRRLIPLRSAFGANRAVYCLDSRGAALLRLHRGGPIAWRPADNDRELFFIEHLAAANDFRVIMTLACRRLGLKFEWTDERALRVAAARRQTRDRTAMSVIPDGHFFLTDAADRRYGFALELDRATVGEKPFKQKIKALQEWKLSGAYRRELGSDSLRVLFVVARDKRDPLRLRRIKAWTEAVGGGSLFWFGSREAVGPHRVLETPAWLVARRDTLHPLFEQGQLAGCAARDN